MKTTEVPPSPCPHCGYTIECASHSTRNVSPKPGSVSICFQCGEIALFGEDLRLRMPTVTELLEMQRDRAGWREMETMQRAVREFQRKKKTNPTQ